MLFNIKQYLIILFLIYSLPIIAAQGEAFHFYLENDTRDIGGPGSDNAYSSGLKLSYVAAADQIPGWARPFVRRSEILQQSL